MNTPTPRRVTGFIMPVGAGAVGKTCVARVLDSVSTGGVAEGAILREVRKTKNLEFEYVTAQQIVGSTQYAATLQLLVPPGQQQSDGDPIGRSFKKVIEIYQPVIHRLDVLLFTYSLANRKTFQDLVYWTDAAGPLVNDAAHLFLLGTHLDLALEQEVSSEDIKDGVEYLRKRILTMHQTWSGNCIPLEVSNLTGENVELLLNHLANSVISSRLNIEIPQQELSYMN